VELRDASVVVTGGASGLGQATAFRLQRAGARVCIVDLHPFDGADGVDLGVGRYLSADITDEASVAAALDAACELDGALRGVVHCAGRGGDRVRILDRAGKPGPIEAFAEVVRVNLIGTYNILRLAAERMAGNEPTGEERGAIIMTASVAAFDGQIGQTAYAASKAAIHGITLVAARDLASRLIRVNTIAPGVFDTPMLGRLRPDIRAGLEAAVPHPSRLGNPEDYARLAVAMLENPYLNGETIRLDGAIRMAPR
jgi:NAD(P)-dependent dehydrogenase (short-subunit alcohol dehydrogenase family)